MPGRSISRRSFLRTALGAGAGALAASVPLGCSIGGTLPAPRDGRLEFFTPQQWATLDAVADRIAPAGPNSPGGRALEVATAADRLFAKANPHLQADLKKLLDTFEKWPVLALHFWRFSDMRPAERDRYLHDWEQSPIPLLRQGFVALDKLAMMLYFMDARSWSAIGYPGPWIGRFDMGLGLDNQADMAAPVNPNVFAKVS